MTTSKRKIQKKSCKKEKKGNQTLGTGEGQNRVKKQSNGVKYAIRRTENLCKNSLKRCKNVKKSYSDKKRSVELLPVSEDSNKVGLRSCKNLKKQKTNSFKKKKQQTSSVIKKRTPSIKASSDSVYSTRGKLSEESEGTSKNITFVSLDLLEESTKYKTMFGKTANEAQLKKLRKKIRSISSYHKRFLDKKEEDSPKVLKTPKSQEGIENIPETPKRHKSHPSQIKLNEIFPWKNSKQGSSSLTQSDIARLSKQEKLNADSWEPLGESPLHNYIELWPKRSVKLTPEQNIATIDTKYIQSILRLTTKEEKEEPLSETRGQQTGKISGKVFYERKLKKRSKKLEKIPEKPEKDSPSQDKKKTLAPVETGCARLVRDLTKSEVQVKTTKNKQNTKSGRQLEMKSEKKVAYSKTEIAGGNKKRKTRTNAVKKENDEYIEIPFPCEVSKGEDVKELWRRDTRKESENSLSSHSSCTVAVTENIYDLRSGNLGIESYNTLKKLVEEEVHKISKKYIGNNANIIKEKHSKEKLLKVSHPNTDDQKPENKQQINEGKIPKTENLKALIDPETNELDFMIKRRIQQTEKQQKYLYATHQEDVVDKPKPLSKENFSELKTQLKFLAKEKGIDGKIPSDIVKNWSTLRRLEKAFLALGTPNFENKNLKAPSRTKGITTCKNIVPLGGRTRRSCETDSKNTLRKNREMSERRLKKDPKPKDRDSAATFICDIESTPPTTPKDSVHSKVGENKMKVLNNNNTNNNKRKTPIKTDSISSHGSRASEGDQGGRQKREKIVQSQGKQLSGNNTPVKMLPKLKQNPQPKSDAEDKLEHIKCNTRKDLQGPKKFLENRKIGKKKSSRVLSSSEDENLERQKTFDIIPLKDATIVQYQFSRSCNKIDETSEKSKPPPVGLKSRSCGHRGKVLDFWEFFDNKTSDAEKDEKNEVKLIEDEELEELQTSVTQTEVREKIPPEREPIITKPISRGNAGNEESFVSSFKGKSECIEIQQRLILGSKSKNIKERSILSMRGEKSLLKKLPESTILEQQVKDSQKDFSVLIQKDHPMTRPSVSKSNVSCTSTGTYDLVDPNLQNGTPYSKTPTHSDNSVTVNKIQKSFTTDSDFILSDPSGESCNVLDGRHPTITKNQQLWEQDIRCYREIVKDIMNQYERLGGLLKQTKNLHLLRSDELLAEKSKPFISKSPHNVSIREYRKKVISEYNALPIVEYKSQIQKQKKETEEKRSLTVARILTPETDEDIKDYHPNVQKVLDSQLYVDSKPRGDSIKEMSLHELKLSDKMVEQECPRTISAPKAIHTHPFSLYHSKVDKTPYEIKKFSIHKPSSVTLEISTSEFDQSESDFSRV